MNIGNRIAELRRQKELPQSDFAKAVGVSREMIVYYKPNEVMPSIEMTKKNADALEVSLNYLAGEGKQACFDKRTLTLNLIHEIEELEPSIKEKLFFLANTVICDTKTKKAYAK